MALFRIPPPESERLYYLLRCKRCGRQDWYVVNLAERGFRCDESHRPTCRGKLFHVATCKGGPPPSEHAGFERDVFELLNTTEELRK